MVRAIGIGNQDYEKIRINHNFYIDKTEFIREWWEATDEVTLITRPRRFGKTLNMSMLEKFFLLTTRTRKTYLEEKNYQANLIAKGIPEECIRKYGFAFCGKKVLIGSAPAKADIRGEHDYEQKK